MIINSLEINMSGFKNWQKVNRVARCGKMK
jgi:hypothetical protein